MSDMAADRLSIRLSPTLRRKLARAAAVERKPEAAVVRQALESYFGGNGQPVSCYDVAKRMGVIGMAKNLPRDLSTNKKYFEGFGR